MYRCSVPPTCASVSCPMVVVVVDRVVCGVG